MSRMYRDDIMDFKNEIARESYWDKCDDKEHKRKEDIKDLGESLEYEEDKNNG